VSQDFVTRDELKMLEERIEAQRVAFETRVEAQWKRFMGEVNGHVVRISEDAQSGRSDLIESNQAVVRELQSLRVHVDAIVSQGTRDRDAYNRNAQGVASRIGTLEASVEKLTVTVQALTHELLRRGMGTESPGRA
jgi:hypothetical protein